MRKQLNTTYYCITPSKILYKIEEISAKSETTCPQSDIVLKTELAELYGLTRNSVDFLAISDHFVSTKKTIKVCVTDWLDDNLQEYGLYKSLKDVMEATCKCKIS